MVGIRTRMAFWLLKILKPISKGNRTIEQQREEMEKAMERFKVAEGMEVEKITMGERPAEKIDYKKGETKKFLLYLHGGAYNKGSPKTHRAFVSQICNKAKISAYVLDYRLAPENPFPAAVDDSIIAYQYLMNKGIEPKNIILAGDSAGGGLTLAILLRLRELELQMPNKAILVSPWVDLTTSTASYEKNKKKDLLLDIEDLKQAAKQYAGKQPLRHPLISPVYANLKGLPPLFIQVGTHEQLYDEIIKLKEKAEKAQVEVHLDEYEKMIHSFQLMDKLIPESKKAIEKISQFIKT